MDHIQRHFLDDTTNKLFQLATLYPASIVARPSKTCKSPYVADVVLEHHAENDMCEDEKCTSSLAHSPSLGCSGLCEKGSSVMVQATEGKCSFRIMLATVAVDDSHRIYVATHPRLAEDVVYYALRKDLISQVQGHLQANLKQQVSFRISRFDFAGIQRNGRPFLMEVKCVPLADYENIEPKERKKKDYNNDVWDPMQKVAYFPEGYRKKKGDVISPRALKHVEELAVIAQEGDIDTYLCFVIQRSDASSFVISCLDPIYKKAVKNAIEQGVVIITLQCDYNSQGECTLVRQNLLDMTCFDDEN